MVGWPLGNRCSPIGVDIGTRSVKLVQFNAERTRVVEAVRWDLPLNGHVGPEDHDAAVVQALNRARQGRAFRGRKAVLCLSGENLFVQNLRVAQATGTELERTVCAEAAGRLPFSSDEAELRFLEADNVRQGDSIRREVILLACRKAALGRTLAVAEQADFDPVAVDVEPAALLRCYCRQYRRDADQEQRVMFVNVGASLTVVVIARGSDAMFIKYLDVGGRHLDDAVAKHLKMSLADATALRRHNGDRRADQRDPEITKSIAEATRPILDRLAKEIAMCLRYYSVTFRGQPLSKLVLGGGEATEGLVEWLKPRAGLECELGQPLRAFQTPELPGRTGQWDVAAGLALRETP
jgi:type IV pilus assembly protein PilM